MATERDRASFEHWHIQRQRSRGYGAFLSDAEFVTRDESGRYRTLGLDDALEAWCAALASAPAAAEHPLMAPEALLKTIGTLLGDAMNTAVENGANSVSMPDEYVALAAWLCETPPQPSQPAPQAGAVINGRPATAESILAALVDIDDDARQNAPEDRCYVESAWSDAMKLARYFVAQPTEQPSQDAQDLDWLETMTVNVRTPLRYGSHDLFWATPEDRDGEAPGPSDIRAKIDAARAAQAQGEKGKA